MFCVLYFSQVRPNTTIDATLTFLGESPSYTVPSLVVFGQTGEHLADPPPPWFKLLSIESNLNHESVMALWGARTELRAELGNLRLKALKARAREVGITTEAGDDFDNADDAKVAAIDAIVSVVCGVSGKPLAVEWKWGSHSTGI